MFLLFVLCAHARNSNWVVFVHSQQPTCDAHAPIEHLRAAADVAREPRRDVDVRNLRAAHRRLHLLYARLVS
jgi:hypothetical protein